MPGYVLYMWSFLFVLLLFFILEGAPTTNCPTRCEFAPFVAANYDPFMLHTVLFPTVINPSPGKRRHHDRWETSCARVLPLRLRRPIRTAQGAICAVLLLEGVQGSGMETRQLALASFLIHCQTWLLSLFKTINPPFHSTVSGSRSDYVMLYCI